MGLSLPKPKLLRRPFESRNTASAVEPTDTLEMRHRAKVERVTRQLREHDPSSPLSLKKKSVSHQVPKSRDRRRHDRKIDVSDLCEVLAIDPIGRTCSAESGVTFVDLVEATLRHGLVPTVVPELKTITIGGAVSGCSLESMSFRYGGFHDSCFEYEIVTTDGKVLTCTEDGENALVFQMMHGSFGTLGVLTKLKFRLVPAKKYVRMTYDTFESLDRYKSAIHRHFVERDVDFMDGIIHGPNRFVLCLGHFVDEAPYRHRYDWTKVYYRSTAERKEDYLRTPDYYFRYDRGVTNVHPKSFIGRLFLGKLLDSTTLLRIAEACHPFLSHDKPAVTVDVFLPFSKLEEFMRWYRGALDFFPLWCVPYRRVRDYEWIADGYFDGLTDDLFVDVAIYGLKQPRHRNYYEEIESAIADLQGIKTLISHNYYDEETFWRIWNKPNYDAVKRITDPKNLLRDLYTKTCLASRGL